MFVDIIFFLIKLIGWLLLILLGLIVVLLLTVLLIPIRYRLRLSHGEEEFHLDSTVYWLLHIVHARITQEGELRRIIVRVFGIILYDSTKPMKPKKVKQDQTKQRKQTKKSLRKPLKKKRKTGAERLSREKQEENRDWIKESRNGNKAEGKVIKKFEDVTEDEAEKDFIKDTVHNTIDNMVDKTIDDRIGNTLNKTIVKSIDKTIDETIDNRIDDAVNDSIEEPDENIAEDTVEDAESILEKIVRKIKAKISGIQHFFRRMVERIKRLYQKASHLHHEISLIKAFINEEDNRVAFGLTYNKLKLLIKHILPTKLRSKLIFGTGDPCSTGQALGIFGILFGVYGEYVQITPDFENKILKGSHYAKGRIRIGTLLIIVIKLLLDKKFKQLLRNYRILKEAL